MKRERDCSSWLKHCKENPETHKIERVEDFGQVPQAARTLTQAGSPHTDCGEWSVVLAGRTAYSVEACREAEAAHFEVNVLHRQSR
jgi:hypothetical protein